LFADPKNTDLRNDRKKTRRDCELGRYASFIKRAPIESLYLRVEMMILFYTVNDSTVT
jgi:hypothetical protein